MSAIRYHDDIPHINRYGMSDKDEEKSWIIFWRQGVGFKVNVDGKDVEGTPFHGKWLEALKTHDYDVENADAQKKWVQSWYVFLDIVFVQCMPLLKELAPEKEHWTTLEDYLHTPSYELKVVAGGEDADAMAAVIAGPFGKPAYESWPCLEKKLEHLSKGIPRFQVKDLVVLGKEKDWRRPPEKVITEDGQVYWFCPCQDTAHFVTYDIWYNNSFDTINASSRLSDMAIPGLNIPHLEGVVVTNPYEDPGKDEEKWFKNQPGHEENDAGTKSEYLVAGVLLTYLNNAKTLADVLKANTDHALSSVQKENWQKQITDTVQKLHESSVTFVGRGPPGGAVGEIFSHIHRHTIMLSDLGDENGGTAWLTAIAGVSFHDGQDQKFEAERGVDIKAIKEAFAFEV